MRTLILALCAVPAANHLSHSDLRVKQDTEFLQPRNFSETLHGLKLVVESIGAWFRIEF